MQKMLALVRSRSANIVSGLILSVIWTMFAYRHIEAFLESGKFVFLLFCVSESLAAIFFLIRSTPKDVSFHPFDWFIAAGGTFTPFLFIPGGYTLWSGGQIFVIIAAVIKITAVLSLNRSFGIVVAMRNIKTSGLYSVVRHPIYASYFISYSGYILFNFTSYNLSFVFAALLFHQLRLIREEEFLSSDPEYIAYMKRVPWRLIPFVY